jgi:hypothetical protein
MTCIFSVETIPSVGSRSCPMESLDISPRMALVHVRAEGAFCYQPSFPGFWAAASSCSTRFLCFWVAACTRGGFCVCSYQHSLVRSCFCSYAVFVANCEVEVARRIVPRYLHSKSLHLIVGALRTPFSPHRRLCKTTAFIFLESRQFSFSSCAPTLHTRSSCVRYVPIPSTPDTYS